MHRLKTKLAMFIAMVMLMTSCNGHLKDDMEAQQESMNIISAQIAQKDSEQKAAFAELQMKVNGLVTNFAAKAKQGDDNIDIGAVLMMGSMLQNANQAGQGIGTEEVIKLAVFNAVKNLEAENKAPVARVWADPVKRGQLMGFRSGQ